MPRCARPVTPAWAVCIALVLAFSALAALDIATARAADQSSPDAVLKGWMKAWEANDDAALKELRKPNEDFDDQEGDQRPEYPKYKYKDCKALSDYAYDHSDGKWAVRAFEYTMQMIASEGAEPVSWPQKVSIAIEKIDSKWFVNPYVQLGIEECPDDVDEALRKVYGG